VISKVEMTLAKADLAVASHYVEELLPEAHREVGERIFAQIRSEMERTCRSVLEITGHAQLLDDNPALQRSIALRNTTITPLGHLQAALLKHLRSGEHSHYGRHELLRGALLTINGIAAGMRNTG
jgi:phosphoenolpyruvate carboxylase